MYAGIINKNNRKHKSKKVVSGKCVFPFKFRRKEYNECLDTGNGPWCPTSLTKSGTVNTWGYCIDQNISNSSIRLVKAKHNSNKIKSDLKNIQNRIRKLTKRTKNKIDLGKLPNSTPPMISLPSKKKKMKLVITPKSNKSSGKVLKKEQKTSLELPGFFLFPNCLEQKLEDKLINIIDTDPRFIRSFNNGKIFYQMGPEHFPEEWLVLLKIISNLHESCVGFDYSLQLKYQPGVRFNAHYDSKHRWEEFIVGVNLKSEAELYFTKKDTQTITKKIPPRSIYVLSGDSRYKWRHGIKKVKELRYSITLRKKTEKEKRNTK